MIETHLSRYNESPRSALLEQYGSLALTADKERAPLPAGYKYASPGSIEPLEVVRIMQKVEIGEGIPDDHIQTRNETMHEKGIGIIDVGIRANDDALVGFSSIYYRDENGELGDFVVSPEHQHKGIGKALISERLKIAEAAGIKSLYIASLERTNTLKAYYLEKGFHITSAGEVVRGPKPLELF